jgi:hypothetical protein
MGLGRRALTVRFATPAITQQLVLHLAQHVLLEQSKAVLPLQSMTVWRVGLEHLPLRLPPPAPHVLLASTHRLLAPVKRIA